MSIRVLLADDHPLMLAGLQVRLGAEPDIEVVGTVTQSNEVIGAAEEHDPDVLVADLAMPGGSFLDFLPALRQAKPDLHVLVLTASDDAHAVVRALESGATGFLSKSSDSGKLAEHIRAAATGTTVLDEHSAAAVATMLRTNQPRPALSERELEVLGAVAKGQTNAEIAEALYVGISTVKTHLDRIFEKLGVRDRAAAVAQAKDHGLI